MWVDIERASDVGVDVVAGINGSAAAHARGTAHLCDVIHRKSLLLDVFSVLSDPRVTNKVCELFYDALN
jgi:hypothetical protein